ncbi:MAG: hypothetical protein ACLFVO_12985 [Chloroflexaceae bacterium]
MSEKHEPAGAAMYQAILRLAGDITSGRAEETILFDKKFAHSANFLSNKIKMYHAAAGESGFHLGTCPVCVPTA